MLRLTMIGGAAVSTVALLVVVVSAGYEPAPDFVLPEGGAWLPPTKYCESNPAIRYLPFVPNEAPEPIPDPNGCEPAIVFCGLNPNSTQRVDWCGSSSGMPSGMGWSNNVGYAVTTNCALGAKYSDCNLDNENGIDVGSVVVSVDDQTFTVSVNPGYAISEYNIQVGSSLNTAASDRYQSYQTRGGILASGASVSSGVSFQSSDWFVMQVMKSRRHPRAGTRGHRRPTPPVEDPEPVPEEPPVEPETVPEPPAVECEEDVGKCWSTTGGFLNEGIQATSKSYTFGGNVGPHGNWEVVDHMTGDNFHSNDVQVVECLKVPGVTGPSPGGPKLEQNMLKFKGTGSLRDGVTGEVKEGLYFTGCVIDAGEPAGRGQNDHDYFEIVVCEQGSTSCDGSGLCDASTVAAALLTPAPQVACNGLASTAFAACGNLDGGNVQLHPYKKDRSGSDCEVPIPAVMPPLPDDVPVAPVAPSCVPTAKVPMCPGGAYNMFWAKTLTPTSWEPSPGYGQCINTDANYMPEGFTGPITKVDGDDYFEVDGSSNSDVIQKFKFKASAGSCFMIEGSHKAGQNCFGANMKDCMGIEFTAQEHLATGRTQDISHGELIFACCGSPADVPDVPEPLPPIVEEESTTTAAATAAPTAAEPAELVLPREDTEGEGTWEPEADVVPDIPCDPAASLGVCDTYTLYWAKTSSATAWASSPGPGHCINKHATDIPAGFSGPIYKVDASEYWETVPSFTNTLVNQKFQFKVPSCFIVDGAHKAGKNCFNDTRNGNGCQTVEFYAQAAGPNQFQSGMTQEISHNELIFACCGGVRDGAVAQTFATTGGGGGGNAMRRTQERRKSPWW